jgi:hypothetical protein
MTGTVENLHCAAETGVESPSFPANSRIDLSNDLTEWRGFLQSPYDLSLPGNERALHGGCVFEFTREPSPAGRAMKACGTIRQ